MLDEDDDLPDLPVCDSVEEYIAQARDHFAKLRLRAHRDLDEMLNAMQARQERSFRMLDRDVEGLPRQ